ncbi:hypothetical protein [Rathayibacter sp. VKM Ac-2857]|uniref:hypothetical protein n=1 Tax=Rathayibacter sp. VKM Ac-2857 TaxID=2739020 RepID=UPI001565F180|nr:hypothetical protein [Rathayibacter sp. VKM Ac-2857]NQX14995.1 hypothetical protein [Rathayibacter sp. VKM Ac-2857]
MSDLEPEASDAVVPSATPGAELVRFESGVRNMLEEFGLPTEQLFVPVSERVAMVGNVSTVLSELDAGIRAESHYVSKMVAAATVGLFDAALNYLWDELVSALRSRVAGFDLAYFFDIAAGTNSDLRRSLKGEDDLPSVDDARLLRASREIGLISDVGFARLDHIRFMRNHASAAHPNQNELTGLELVTFLQLCVREVINTPTDTVTAHTGRLLANMKRDLLDQASVDTAAAFFDQLPPDRVDTLANGIFGLYTSPDRTPIVADNVRLLWPRLWPFIGDAARRSFGLRHGRASASAETDLATAARELIDLVNGTAYLTTEVRAIDMSDALDLLNSAHHGFDNFYNEATPARRVLDLAGERGDVPAAIRERYIGVVVDCFLGNGYGISAAAAVSYKKMLGRFSSTDAGVALRLFLNPVYSSLMSGRVGQAQWAELLDILEPKLTSTIDRNLMTALRSFPGTPDKLGNDSNIKRLAETRV